MVSWSAGHRNDETVEEIIEGPTIFKPTEVAVERLGIRGGFYGNQDVGLANNSFTCIITPATVAFVGSGRCSFFGSFDYRALV